MPDPLISTADLVNYIGRGGTTDPGIVIAVDAASDICRDVAGVTFNWAGTSTILLDGTGTDALLLPELPVSAAGTVVVAGGTVTDYVLNDNGILFRKQTGTDVDYTETQWSRSDGLLGVVRTSLVTYSHGYESADLPRSVRMVALAVASRLVIQGPAIVETVGEKSPRNEQAGGEHRPDGR